MSVEVRLRVAGGNDTPAHVESLWDWLRSDRDLRGTVKAARAPSAEEAMGPPIELLVALSSSGGATALALCRALRTWLEQRRSDISLTVTEADGRSVTVSAKRVSEADKVLRSLLIPRDDEAS